MEDIHELISGESLRGTPERTREKTYAEFLENFLGTFHEEFYIKSPERIFEATDGGNPKLSDYFVKRIPVVNSKEETAINNARLCEG